MACSTPVTPDYTCKHVMHTISSPPICSIRALRSLIVPNSGSPTGLAVDRYVVCDPINKSSAAATAEFPGPSTANHTVLTSYGVPLWRWIPPGGCRLCPRCGTWATRINGAMKAKASFLWNSWRASSGVPNGSSLLCEESTNWSV
jgi:hypothetical protein